MKKRNIVIISGILVIAAIAIFLSALFFPLKKSDLTANALQSASKCYCNKISDYNVRDSKFSNNSIAFIYQFKLENGEKRNYAVAYEKHFLFSRYRFASYTDYSRLNFGDILIVKGIPYEIVYDISKYSLEVKAFALNDNLIKVILGFITAVLIMLVLLSKRIYTKRSHQQKTGQDVKH